MASLAYVKTLCKLRNETIKEETINFAMLARKYLDYPADVAVNALALMHRFDCNGWFPKDLTSSEDALDAGIRQRNSFERAVRLGLRKHEQDVEFKQRMHERHKQEKRWK